jgi:hypothetical protein
MVSSAELLTKWTQNLILFDPVFLLLFAIMNILHIIIDAIIIIIIIIIDTVVIIAVGGGENILTRVQT